MATEVKHGPLPAFEAEISPGTFSATVVGHYTTTPNLAAAGVTHFNFKSDQPIKRRAELLALRSAFKHWFDQESLKLGFSPEGPYAF